LVAGEVFALAPERAVHARTKLQIAARLSAATGSAGLGCEVFPDGMAVRIAADTVYEPDALVRCGAPLDNDAIEVTDPIIIVEVVSPSPHERDTGSKLADYFRLPSLRHYLIVNTKTTVIVHHARDAAGTIATRIVRDGPIRLDPPGIELTDAFA
jgi:Uma2 family endonuclease